MTPADVEPRKTRRRSVIDPRRSGRYERIHAQLKGLIEGRSPSLTAAMATLCAVLHAKMPHHFWTGFYFVHSERELHVGPYQGPLACQILRDRGVCLRCAVSREPIVIPDVEQFPGHVACDTRSRSEIALPLISEDTVVAVLDIDSDKPAAFDEDDFAPLARIVALLVPFA